MPPGPVGAVALAKWQDVQQELRHLTLQRGLRFIAAAVLAPFGVSSIGRDQGSAGPALSSWAFGLALLLLALAELASMVESALHARERAEMERRHTALKPKGKPGRLARLVTLVSGPGFSATLYALLGAAFILASVVS